MLSELPRPTQPESCQTGFSSSLSVSTVRALFDKYLVIASLPQRRLQACYIPSTESVLCLFIILFSNLLFILLNYAVQNGLTALNL